jgi:uncharacterized membrane protein
MQAKLRNTWENIWSSLWFLPAVLVLGAVTLAFGLVEVDVILEEHDSQIREWITIGTSDASRDILGVIAGSLVTVISIAFSMTLIALQQNSSQFSPRVLRNFTSDRGNQIVLGVYIGTFIYALLVMRQVRSSQEDVSSFIPAVSLAVALSLSLICLGLLIYYIHHISQQLQVSAIVEGIHKELLSELERLYPTRIGEETAEEPLADRADNHRDDSADVAYLYATRAGFLRAVDDDALFKASEGHTPWLRVRPCIGDYVPYGGLLAEYPRGASIDQDREKDLREAFVQDTERTMHQDPLFGLRQLVDIALRALSPGINDPTTAEYCLSHLGDVLGRLATREFPASVRQAPDGETRYIMVRPTWPDFVDTAFSQIRRAAADDVHVTGHLLRVFQHLALMLPPGSRGNAIRHEVEEVQRAIDQSTFSDYDRLALRRLVAEVEDALDKHVAKRHSSTASRGVRATVASGS